jgi:alkanesulfonate monooxygenase SsuD/methylene tetrahydromethanopterin reductase-like flavin-dependent oxidoreductase (luciferase family)
VRHGIFLPPFGPFGDPTALVDLAVAAEGRGWDGMASSSGTTSCTASTAPTSTPGSPWPPSQRALTVSSSAPSSRRSPRRRPWKLALEAVTLDHLSNGRLVLGAGIGTDRSREFSAFGEPSEDRTRAELLDEGLDIVTQLWTGESVHHSGRHFHVDGVRFLPRQFQQPRIHIWVWRPLAPPSRLRRAARDDGVVPIGELPPKAVTELVSEVARNRTTEEPFDVAVASLDGQRHSSRI